MPRPILAALFVVVATAATATAQPALTAPAAAPQGSDWSSVSGAYDRAPRRQAIGFALVGVGVAAAVTGVVLAVTGGSDDDASADGDSGVSAWVDRGTAGVVGWGTF